MNFDSEQLICISCGFCCDGTLFINAVLEPDEKGNLPEKIEYNYFIKDDKEFFKLPCLYFDTKCTIYNLKKANVCSAYRCQLLKDFVENKITQTDAFKIVKKATVVREEIFDLYQLVSGNKERVYFKELLLEIGKMNAKVPAGNNPSIDYELLTVRCNIFEILLIKHFRSIKDFNSMVKPENEEENFNL